MARRATCAASVCKRMKRCCFVLPRDFCGGTGRSQLGTLVGYTLILKFFGSVSNNLFKVGGGGVHLACFPCQQGHTWPIHSHFPDCTAGPVRWRAASADCSRSEPDTDTRVSAADTASPGPAGASLRGVGQPAL